MATAASTDVAFLRVSTRDVPDSERVPFWREVFARQMCHLEFEPCQRARWMQMPPYSHCMA
jgi:hypothetical protein